MALPHEHLKGYSAEVDKRVAELEADNERLRAALRKIVDLAAWEPTRATNIARRALGEER